MPLPDELTPSIKPGDDFYHYVNQRWTDEHPIPDSKARIGVFEDLMDGNVEKLKILIESPTEPSEPANIRLLKDYYRAAMDEDLISRQTSAFVASICKAIEAVNTPDEIAQIVAESHASGLELIWNAYIEPDDKDSSHYVLRFGQGGLGLPDRDYYIVESKDFAQVKTHYLTFLTSLFELAGYDRAGERATGVFELERKLAAASMTATEKRDPDAMYNAFDPSELTRRYPEITWDHYFDRLGFASERTVIVSQPDFMAAVVALWSELPLEQWKDYLIFHSLLPFMNKLDTRYVDLQFGFYGTVLSGTKKLELRYRRIVRNCIAILPEPTGQLFVSAHFDESAKAEIGNLVKHLQVAFGKRIDELTWMGPETKLKAHEKLATFLPLLGYPDEWRDYGTLTTSDCYADNFRTMMRDEWRRSVSRIDGSVDRREWLMSAALVNAYYWPNTNGITFPAAILQPPFFDPKGDFASNYGAIGGVIGHEITHGFDDEGSKFDAFGNLKTWWKEADRTAFEELADGLVTQYDQYEIAGGKVNGRLTLGENIADLGGLQMAYDALCAKVAESCGDAIDGFTPEQRFFIGYARAWRESRRPELMRQTLVSDPHSPDIFRTNGVVRNLDAFYNAFDLIAGDKLYLAPEDRVRIW